MNAKNDTGVLIKNHTLHYFHILGYCNYLLSQIEINNQIHDTCFSHVAVGILYDAFRLH